MTEQEIEKRMDQIDVEKMLGRPPVEAAVCAMLIELARAEKAYPTWPTDPIHQIAIMAEEAGEAVQAANNLVHHNKANGAYLLRCELVQAGAMILRCLINMEGGK